MLVVLVRIAVVPGEEAPFLEAIRTQAAASRLEPGCRGFDVAVDADRSGAVLLYEVYEDDAAFASHLASAHFGSFAAATRHMIAEKVVERWTLVPSAVGRDILNGAALAPAEPPA